MFDLVAGRMQHVPSTPTMPIVVSTIVQGSALGVIFVASFVMASGHVPTVPAVMAFVVVASSTPPPPPPPAPPITAARSASTTPKAIPTNVMVPPLVSPLTIEPEAAATNGDPGVPGGVEGGVAGGVVGGIPAAIDGPPPPPPPPPPAPPSRPQVARIGGQLKAPALIHRVEPDYPLTAQFARISGVVLLDAIVDAAGHVQTITVLKGHPLLAPAAINAVKQWQYAPLLLNGDPIPFELTVTLVFNIPDWSR